MKSTEQRIANLANEIASGSQNSAANLQRELREVEAQKAEIEAKLNTANLALERLANFQVKIGAYFQCPICWIMRGIRARYVPVGYPPGMPVGADDMFRCEKCQSALPLSE